MSKKSTNKNVAIITKKLPNNLGFAKKLKSNFPATGAIDSNLNTPFGKYIPKSAACFGFNIAYPQASKELTTIPYKKLLHLLFFYLVSLLQAILSML